MPQASFKLPTIATLATIAMIMIFMPIAYQLLIRLLHYISFPDVTGNLTSIQVVQVPEDVANTSGYRYFERQVDTLTELAMYLMRLLQNPYTLAMLIGLGLLYTVYERFIGR